MKKVNNPDEDDEFDWEDDDWDMNIPFKTLIWLSLLPLILY